MSRIASTFRRLIREEGGWYRPLVPLAVAICMGAGAVAYYHSGTSGTCEFPSCFPDASNTGVPSGTTLTTYSGANPVTTDNTVIDGKNIDCIEIQASNVTIKNSHVSCNISQEFLAVRVTSGSLTLQDSEVDCQDTNANGVGSINMTLLRVDVHGCENGIDIDDASTVTDSYIHDLVTDNGAHTDGIQVNQGADSVEITHNTVDPVPGSEWLSTSAINVWNEGDPQVSNVLIQQNRLLGEGNSFAIYTPRFGPVTNLRVINNHLETGVGGYQDGDASFLTDASGNVDWETFDPITF